MAEPTPVDDDPDAFRFLGTKGGYLRGGNFRRASNWSRAIAEMGVVAGGAKGS
jgi:hypothetical protein